MSEQHTLSWVKMLGSTKFDSSQDVAIDSNNNVYITGHTNGTFPDASANTGSDDAYVAKYDSNGNRQWVKMLGSTNSDESKGVAIDSNNNVYITGYTYGTLPDVTDNVGGSAYLAKYDSNGNRQWVKMLVSTTSNFPQSVAIDSNNNVYITGYTYRTFPDASANAGPAGTTDAYVAKYNSNGNIQWVKMLGSNTSDFSHDVAIDSNNNVYITGRTQGTFPDASANAGPADTSDAYLAKYDSNGNRQWVKMLGSNAYDDSQGVAIDSNNNVYITGYTEGTFPDASANAGGSAYLAKYDSNGNRQWVKMLASTSTEQSHDVAIDSNNNVYITGYTNGTFPGESANAGPAGTSDAYLAKYDSNGNRQWVKMLGSNNGYDVSQGVAIDSNNNVYITGNTERTFQDASANAGYYDAYLAKYAAPLITPSLSNFSIPTKMVDDSPFTITDPSSTSLGAFSYTSSNTAVASVSGKTLTIQGAGNTTITASQAATSTHAQGTITTTFEVIKRDPSLSNFSIPTKIFGDSPFTITDPSSTSSGAFSYTSSNTAVASVSVKTLTIVGTGNTTITASQAATSTYNAGTITTTFQVIKRDPLLSNFSIPTKMVDDSPFTITDPSSTSLGAFSYTSSNTAVASVSGKTLTIVGTGNTTITASQAATSTYNAGTITTTFQVNDYTIPANITLDDANTYNVASGNVQVSIIDADNISTNKVSYWYSTTGGVPNINSMLNNNGPSQTNYRFYIPLSSGTYTISVYAKNPSGNSSIVSKNVTVYTLPFAPVIDTGNTKSVTSGNLIITFTDLSNNANNQVEYTYFLYNSIMLNQITYLQ
jgi:hypothetical protein